MSQNWAEALLFICVIAQFFCVTASLTSASRMLFAFSRDGAVPGTGSGAGREEPRPAGRRIDHILSAAIMIPAIWNYLVGYLVGTGIAVIGLYVAFILPVILRYRLGDKFEHGAWSLGNHYKWIDLLAIVWVAFISILFLLPPYKSSVFWADEFTWEAANYAPILVGARRSSAAGTCLRSQVVQGPGPMGTEEELEQFEQRDRGHDRHAAGPRGLAPGLHTGGASRAGAPPHPVQAPPFWSIAWPVTPDASGERSQATVPAISSGRPSGRVDLPQRFGDSLLPAHARRLDDRVDSLPRHVCLHPARQIAFTCTSSGASSAEKERTSPSRPAFEALYAVYRERRSGEDRGGRPCPAAPAPARGDGAAANAPVGAEEVRLHDLGEPVVRAVRVRPADTAVRDERAWAARGGAAANAASTLGAVADVARVGVAADARCDLLELVDVRREQDRTAPPTRAAPRPPCRFPPHPR